MKSHLTPQFRALLAGLPEHVRRQAREAYRLCALNPQHPSLRFKRVRTTSPVYSVRVGAHYRALGYFEDDIIVWVWIGSHAEYDHLIERL